MRALPLVPVLVFTLACGSSKLNQQETASDIRKDYPVLVTLKVQENESAIIGSPQFAKLVLMQEKLTQNGWFSVTRKTESDRERFQFQKLPNAPGEIRNSAKGWEIPVAKAEFVKVTRMKASANEAKVGYQIRMADPSPHFPLFKAFYPKAHIGETKERIATYRKEGRAWILQGTDEAFKKVQ